MDTGIEEIRQMVSGISQVEMTFPGRWLSVIIASIVSSTNVAELAHILAHSIMEGDFIYI